MTEKANDITEDLLSIGDVAKATGISVETIRVWERRYGRPAPVRLPSGHRRYTDDHVRWLRRVAEAISQGHRPSRLVRLDDRDLEDLLRQGSCEADDAFPVGDLLELVADYRGAELTGTLRAEAETLGPRDLLRRRVAPLITAAGRAWADGDLAIRQEHFLTAVLEDFLSGLCRSIPESEDGPILLLTTLSDELHGLGLQMAAVMARLAGGRPRLLGTDTPVDEIVLAAVENDAQAVGVSVSLATGGVTTDRILRALRDDLPEAVELIVGGQGARGVRRGPRGVTYLATLDDLEAHLRRRSA